MQEAQTFCFGYLPGFWVSRTKIRPTFRLVCAGHCSCKDIFHQFSTRPRENPVGRRRKEERERESNAAVMPLNKLSSNKYKCNVWNQIEDNVHEMVRHSLHSRAQQQHLMPMQTTWKSGKKENIIATKSYNHWCDDSSNNNNEPLDSLFASFRSYNFHYLITLSERRTTCGGNKTNARLVWPCAAQK